jgi:hypothetical protein
VVHLHQRDGGDAAAGVEKTQNGAAGTERLRDHDAPYDRGMNFAGNILGEQMSPSGLTPAPEKRCAEQQNVEPVNAECGGG